MRRKTDTYRHLSLRTNIALLLAWMLCTVAAGAAERYTQIDASLTTATGNGGFSPSYIMNNRQGTLTTPSAALGRLGVEYSLSASSHFSLWAGADVIGGYCPGTDYLMTGSQATQRVSNAPVWLQQCYAQAQWRNVFLTVGMRERESVFVSQQLSSGDLCFSGNSRPMPGVTMGFANFCDIPLTNGWVQICGELSFAKATHKKWMEERYNHQNYFITTGEVVNYKYVHFRTKPSQPFSLTIGMQAACQIGGTRREYAKGELVREDRQKVGAKELFKALIPGSGGSQEGDQAYYEGNHLGTWDVMGTIALASDDKLRLYYQSPWEDGSGIGKLNGFDGLYGLEYISAREGIIEGAVIEYIDLMNQSGPMHWAPADFENHTIMGEATGADDYYNNYFYCGYQHYGMSIGSPLIRTAIYNTDGYLRITDNRLRGFHAAITGHISPNVQYWLKAGYRRSLGTPFVPLLEPRSATSVSVEARYQFADRLKGLSVHGQVAGDFGNLLGNNFGAMVKIAYSFGL
ncbi:MAG: capsule assembly Wzi family protein [Bacteroidales bacterium]|nr:capsule assembly Wzi family protein [Bacteroidales bacterium]